jgi:ABC-type Na+ efflux pump permease subunit
MSLVSDQLRRGFWRRVGAMIRKEFVQLRRDRITFATIVTLPLMQLLLFGYAINTQPHGLPTAVLLQETSDVGRTILKALENTAYFKVTRQVHDEAEFDRVLQSGEVLFAVEVPRGFERALRRGDKPALLVAADATDPVATSTALGALNNLLTSALRNDRAIPDAGQPPFEIRTHARYNPAASSQLNIVPGLMGTILTLTMLIFTALSVTREVERGTMESLLSMPITPLEIMLGKIMPYVLIGFLQAALIVAAGVPAVRRADLRQPGTAGGAVDLVHRHQSCGRLHVLDSRAKPAPGHPDGDDVLLAEHAAVGLRIPVPRHAGLGAVVQRVAAADPLHPDRALDHARARRCPICSTTRWRWPA